MVLIKKANRKWWICIDYTNLNKVCPKDSYPLLMIDRLVDTTSSLNIIYFMDAFFGYNQIQMAKEDEEKMAFITNYSLHH